VLQQDGKHLVLRGKKSERLKAIAVYDSSKWLQRRLEQQKPMIGTPNNRMQAST
jgi:hypothetical protein